MYGTFTNVPHSFGVISFKKVCAPKPIVLEPTPEPLFSPEPFFFTPIAFKIPKEIPEEPPIPVALIDPVVIPEAPPIHVAPIAPEVIPEKPPTPVAPIAPEVIPEKPQVRDVFCSPIGFGIAAGVVILLRIGILVYVLSHRKPKEVPEDVKLPIDFIAGKLK